MKTERRSPIITSGVATPSTASNNIAAVITMPASNPASRPAEIAFVLLTTQAHFMSVSALRESNCARVRREASQYCSVRCAQRMCVLPPDGALRPAHATAADSGADLVVERIFRTRSTTIAEVTCFMQA